jgi:ElaB/YqjD/DUF883 family membrane-anchored ribosome-binding protein
MTPTIDSPQARLAASRKSLVRQMARDDGRADNDASNNLHGSNHAQKNEAYAGSGRSSTWQVFTQAAMAWWQHHPVQVAVDIGRPFLNNYARDKPLQLIGIAAGVGAAAVLIKPWRLVSVTGLVVAALKSTKLSTTLLSLLQRTGSQSYSKQTQQPTKDTP